MANGEQKPEKKVSTAEAVIMILLSLLFDGIEFVLGLLLVGEFTNPITNILFSGVFIFWFTMKGIRIPSVLLGTLLEFVPVINLLPIRTATVIITIMIANNPKLSAVTQAASIKKGIPS